MKIFKNKKGYEFKMHIIIGLIVLVSLWYINNIYNWIETPVGNQLYILFGIAIIYSLLPDVDQQASIINKYVIIGLVATIIYSFYNPLFKPYGITAAIIIGLLEFINHRTILHSVLGGLILSAPLFYFGMVYFVVGFIAFLTHIIADNDFSFGWEKDHLWKKRR